MKALSLWQPWASLIAVGAKQYETRSWSTLYRGLLAIHAAKRYTHEEHNATLDFERRFPFQLLTLHSPLPLGAILCMVRLTEVLPVASVYGSLSDSERAFGNYSEGRFAWKLALVEVFDPPIPMRGAQGLFEVKLP